LDDANEVAAAGHRELMQRRTDAEDVQRKWTSWKLMECDCSLGPLTADNSPDAPGLPGKGQSGVTARHTYT